MKQGERDQASLPGVNIKKRPEQGLVTDVKNAEPERDDSRRHFLSRWILRKDELLMKGVKDAYSIHRLVYDLFPASEAGETGRILYCDKGPGRRLREILILSAKAPIHSGLGDLETKIFSPAALSHHRYRFNVTINPVIRHEHKAEPIKDREAIAAWFTRKAPSFGFEVAPNSLETLDVQVERFPKRLPGEMGALTSVVLEKARLFGVLNVKDKARFVHSVFNGIGRAKAFGCGLLQIAPF